MIISQAHNGTASCFNFAAIVRFGAMLGAQTGGVVAMRVTNLGVSALFVAIGLTAIAPAAGMASPVPYRNACLCAGVGGSSASTFLPSWNEPALPGLRAFPGPLPAVRSKLYVANELEGSLTVIDASTNQAISRMAFSYKVPNSPYEMVFTPRGVVVAPDGKTVWVTLPIPQSDCEGGEGLCDGPNIPPGAMEELVVIDPTACYGCGACRTICSMKAIKLLPRENVKEEAGVW